MKNRKYQKYIIYADTDPFLPLAYIGIEGLEKHEGYCIWVLDNTTVYRNKNKNYIKIHVCKNEIKRARALSRL